MCTNRSAEEECKTEATRPIRERLGPVSHEAMHHTAGWNEVKHSYVTERPAPRIGAVWRHDASQRPTAAQIGSLWAPRCFSSSEHSTHC